ncbi:ankyrin repeat and death domain-containing protein 1A-like isoform X4 [Agrilus planipennis]|uniref:Ankyrin repeat and death domain-containing protein 1A-like isoform X4 n=1 Tax=Agrilus planipennis TaxID=224129 RepID=A0A1W4WS35_AGRPL|nr:ankyrin repeat and death domain-containing protein 1A-like isoform X4 [Agrilus planipennis]
MNTTLETFHPVGARISLSTPDELERREEIHRNNLLLHEAVIKNDTETVRRILKEPVDVNSRNNKNYTLLICAAKNNKLEIVNYLLDTLEDIRVDCGDVEGQTALHHAAVGGHLEVVKKLLDVGATVDKRNKDQRTPLHVACEKGHVEVAKLVLAHEANLEARDAEGNTPLHLAAQQQQTEIVQLLLDQGSDPDAENSKGFTPQHIACSLGSKGILDSLLQHGSSINKPNKAGNTALHLACQSNEIDTVEILISKGADLNALNARLQSPIHIAAEMGRTEICRLLLASGANIEQREQGGRTPLYIAARGSFTAIVDMIIKTARLDYLPHEQTNKPIKKENEGGGLKPVLSVRKKLRNPSRDDGRKWNSERLKDVIFKLAYKQLQPGDWKKLAYHWAFTEEHVRAIEHQYTGDSPSSYKEHGFRMLLIWTHGLAPDANPIKELYDSLIAIDKRSVADALRRKLDLENEERQRGKKKTCSGCNVT